MKDKHAFDFLKKHIKTEDKDAAILFLNEYKNNKDYFDKINFNLNKHMAGFKRHLMEHSTKDITFFGISVIEDMIKSQERDYLKNRLKKRVLIKSLHDYLDEASMNLLLDKVIEKNGLDSALSKIKKNIRNQLSITNSLKLENEISKIFKLPNERIEVVKLKIKNHNKKHNDSVELIKLKGTIYYIKSTEKSLLLFKEICSRQYCVSYSVESYLSNINNIYLHYLFFDLDPVEKKWASFMVNASSLKNASVLVHDHQNKKYKIELDSFFQDEEPSEDVKYISKILKTMFKDVDSKKECYEKFFLKEDLNQYSKSDVMTTLAEKALIWNDVESAKKLISMNVNKKTNLFDSRRQRLCLYLVQEITSEFNGDMALILSNNDALDLLMEKLPINLQKLIIHEIILSFDDVSLDSFIKKHGCFSSRKEKIIKTKIHQSYLEDRLKNNIDDTHYEIALLNILKFKIGILNKSDFIDIERDEIKKEVLFEFLAELKCSIHEEGIKDLLTIFEMMSVDLLENFFNSYGIDLSTSEKARIFDNFFENLKPITDDKKHPEIKRVIRRFEEEWRLALLLEDKEILDSENEVCLNVDDDCELNTEKGNALSNKK